MALCNQIRDAVAAQIRAYGWPYKAGMKRDENYRFVPHPETWLRNERWLDEVE